MRVASSRARNLGGFCQINTPSEVSSCPHRSPQWQKTSRTPMVGWTIHASVVPGHNIVTARSFRRACSVAIHPAFIKMHPPHGSGEVSGTYAFLPPTPSRHSLHQLRAFLMSSPSAPALQKLHHLDRSSPDFHDRLCNVFYGREYSQCAPSLQGDDLVWLVDYIDEVLRHIALPYSPLSQPRLSIVLILPVPLSGSVYVNSKADAALGGYSRHHICFRLTF